MKSHHHAYEVVVATLHGAHHDAVAQHVLEVTARRDGLLDSVGGHLGVEVRGPREVEDGILRGQVVLLVEHAEEAGQIELARVHAASEVMEEDSRLVAVLEPGVVVQRVVVVHGDQHGVPSLHHVSIHPLCALLQLLLHVRHDLVGLRLSPSSRPHVTRAVHAVQHQLVQVHRLDRARVDRLGMRDAGRTHRAELRLGPEQRAVVLAATGQRLQQMPARDVQLWLRRRWEAHIQQQLLTVFGLREEAARSTRHLDDLVTCALRQKGHRVPLCVQVCAEGTKSVIQLLHRQ